MSDIKKYKRILVTGAAGFIGSHLVDSLVARGFQVFSVDDLSGGFKRNIHSKARFTKLDLRNKVRTAEYISKIKPDLIYHLAADATEGRSQFTPLECTERNYLAFLNLIVPAIKTGVLKRIVVTSSIAVYGAQKPPFNEKMRPAPEDLYAISKAAMEEAIKVLASVHGFEWVIVRPYNVYGPKQNLADPYRNVAGIFINSLLGNKPFYIYGAGDQVRSFTYISDCVIPLMRCGLLPKAKGHIINIGSTKPVTVQNLADVILHEFFEGKEVSKKLYPKYLPMRPKEVKFAYSSATKAMLVLGYKAKTPLNKGIAEMISWARILGNQKPVYMDSLELESGDVPKTWKKKLI